MSAYPLPMVFGSGAPSIWLTDKNPDTKLRRLYANRLNRQLSFPNTTRTVITAVPERRLGGDVFTKLSNGNIVKEFDGYRLVFRFEWDVVTANVFARMLEVFNYSDIISKRSQSILLQPSVDVRKRYRVFPQDTPEVRGFYDRMVGHPLTVSFISEQLFNTIPNDIGYGVLQIDIRQLFTLDF